MPIIGAERSCVFPLRIRDAIVLANCDPSVFAGLDTRSLICFSKPGNNAGRFGPMAFPRFIIVRKRTIKRVEPWREIYRNVIAAMTRIGVVDATVVFGPILVP